MKKEFLLLVLAFLAFSCKQNTRNSEQNMEVIEPVPDASAKVSPVLKELLQFAEMTFGDTTNVDELLIFKEIDSNGVVSEINSDRGEQLYKKMMRRGQPTSFPIFELKNTDAVILPIQGTGFGGAIWAKVLLNRTDLKISKIDFGQQAESDGYGKAMTRPSFENQFVGTKINLNADTFSLETAMEKAIDDGQVINGISGATITSQAVVDMVNEGMKKYKAYLITKS